MRGALAKISLFLAATLITIAGLICVMDAIATDPANYIAIHERIETDSGLDFEGVKRADEAMADFLKGKGDLDYMDYVYGKVQRVFNDREIEHMNDVRALFEAARSVAKRLFVAGAVFLIAAILAQKSGFVQSAAFAELMALCAVGAVLGVGGTIISFNFSNAFIAMHSMLFSNDLWLLDPRTDLMIRLLPEEFFMTIAGKMALGAVITVLITGLSAVGVIFYKRMRK